MAGESRSLLPGYDERRYTDAMNDALDRLSGYGPQWGPGLAFHAPMAAEAMAALGYYDEVPGWIERNRAARGYSDQPSPLRPIGRLDLAEQRAALGDYSRVADWGRLFEEELATRPWREVLLEWWPRLLPGLTGALGHGLIRTAHAVRGLGIVTEPSPAQVRELARGMAFWASVAAPPPPLTPPAPLPALTDPRPEQARQALVTATGAAAGLLADRAPRPTIPMVHMVTIPMAMDLVMPYLPAELHPEAYRYGVRASGQVLRWFGSHLRAAPQNPQNPQNLQDTQDTQDTQDLQDMQVPTITACVESAMDTEDEHAIKLAEVCVRSAALHADNKPYVRSVGMLVGLLGRGEAVPRGL